MVLYRNAVAIRGGQLSEFTFFQQKMNTYERKQTPHLPGKTLKFSSSQKGKVQVPNSVPIYHIYNLPVRIDVFL